MSVGVTVILPNQPANGEVTRVPLGGNGFTAPQALYTWDITSTGDASGGLSTIHIRMDPRFAGLVSFVGIRIEGISADKVVQTLFKARDGDELLYQQTIPIAAISGLTNDASGLVLPPPIILPAIIGDGSGTDEAFVRLIMANVNGENLRATGRLFVFDARVREITPYPWIVANLPGL